MKTSLLGFVFIIITITVHAQKDVIYPEIGKTSIRKCTITKVSKGNIVHYIKDSIYSVIHAVAIRKDGKYIDLYPELIDDEILQKSTYADKSYGYYKKQYNVAIRGRNVGVGLTIAGIGAGVIAVLARGSISYIPEFPGLLSILYIGGGVLTNVGITLWIAGGTKAANNYKAMNRAKNNVKLSLAFSDNGLGLRLSFNN